MEELINIITIFALGCGAGAVYSLLGYLSYHTDNMDNKKKSEKPKFDVMKFLPPMLIGGFGAVGIFSFGLTFEEMENLFVLTGVGATGKKMLNILATLHDKTANHPKVQGVLSGDTKK